MSTRYKLKQLAEHIPGPVGKALARVPYAWKLGPVYKKTKKEHDEFERLPVARKKEIITRRVRKIALFAYKNIEFYKERYDRAGFAPSSISDFEDIARAPIFTKGDLRAAGIEKRTHTEPGMLQINTGGSSGEPLEFHIDRHAFAREWAFMHTIWAAGGYEPKNLKITFRGKNLGDAPMRFNPVHNEYYINAYCTPNVQADAIKTVAASVRHVHGYPSSIYEFVRFCAVNRPDVLDILRNNVRSVMMGSEFPAPVYRDLIEEKLCDKTISWYGLSEMTILAPETDRYLYAPFHYYGYCEAVDNGDGRFRLIGTSCDNTASPFIRYDTGDLVAPVYDDGLLVGFRIEDGRVGEFVTDRNGNRIALTSLIFGRHHTIFGSAKFIQIAQSEPGEATLVVVPVDGRNITADEARAGFDLTNVEIDFTVVIRQEPYKTPAGKVPLIALE